MLVVFGSRAYYRTVGHGVFHCERCGGDRAYRQRSGRRWVRVLNVPVVPLDATGEHLRCTICHTCYRVELLAVPTIEQMRAALLAGTTASALAMLWAGGATSQAARRRAVRLIADAGSAEYSEAHLVTALADPEKSASLPAASGPVPGLGPAIEGLAVQLEMHAREWFLANVVQVGLADGPLSVAERKVVSAVARYLGMSQAQAQDVIWLAEEAAQAG